MKSIVKRTETPFDNLVKKFFGEDDIFSLRPSFSLIGNDYAGKTNILENEKDYLFQVSVPGLKKDDIKIEIDEDVLTISSNFEDSKEEKSDNFYRKEFVKSSFTRSFYVPEDVDVSKIDAKMEDGILNVSIPKKEIEKKKDSKLSIKVK